MKLPLLLLCSVSGLCYWFPVQHGHCSEQTHTHTLTTRAVSHQPVIDGSDEQNIFISDVESSSVSSRITHITPVSAAPHVCGSSECVSCRDCTASDSCSAESGITDACTAACDAAENLRYDPQLSSFPAVQESVSVRESRKPIKDQTGNRTNASHILKDQGSSSSADSDPSVPCREQEIPTFEEWTKIMLEVENEKSQITHLSDGPLAAGKKLQQTVTNYASVECGAKILSSNPEAKSTSAILMENMDMYMLNPCNNKIWFIIELCQPIQVKQLDIANFEIFSSNPKDFLVSISDRYPNKKWVKLGTFHARDERTVQSFPLDEHLFAKYIKVELLSHFGSEHFCPLSLIRVFGTSMMEEYEMNSEPSDRQMHVQDEHDYDQPPDYVPVDEKSSKNLIGSAKDALLTMVNNIAASVLGGPPETTAGNSSTEGLNMTEVVFPPGSIHTAASTGPVTVAADPLDVVGITETASITQETAAARTPPLTDAAGDAPVQTTPDVEQIVTLLPDAEDEPDRSSGRITDVSETDHVNENTVHSESACSRSHRVSLQEHLLQRCSSPDFIQKRKPSSRSYAAPAVMTPAITTVTEEPESPVIHARDLAPSLTSDLLRLVSADSLSSRATQPIELMCPSATECLTATVPQQSTDGLSESSEKPNPETLSDVMTTSAALRRDQVARELLSVSSEQVSLENDISTPTVSMNTADESQLSSVSALVDEPAVPGEALTPDHPVHPSDGFTGSAESKRKELFDDESSAHIEQIYTETQNSSDAHAHGSNQKESVFMRLNNRIKVLEMNMSLSGRYLEQLSQRYRKQVEEMQKAFNKTIIKLQNTSRMAEEQDQRQTDSIQALQAQLENMTQLVLSLSVSVSRLQREVSDRQSYILLCLLLCVLLWLLICVNYRQISESPAVDSQRSCCPEREPSDGEPVLLRRRASDPPSLSSLQMPDGGSGETNSFKQWEDCQVSRKKKHKVKLSKGPETLAAPPLADGIPQTTIGPLGLETGPRPDGRDVMSDGSSEGSSQADETLFCGITTCSHLCEALPAPKRWTQSRSQHQRGSRRSQHHQQPPQCSGPPPGLGPARNRL
ncbi:SUN domain-containing ossification factor isoform X1 [Sinocyclocheilus rhinocerous]|uniref:SUN domain-containing ossification factor-like n=1 Tax=Sinocyclocheilus rhinocerous TaxID=307959 RepID=A0A673JRD9_9TELE|nr:PREDICTED: SUN domain-containing ossification factor-like isoform X1 [Sinocyclocheilus rhinocerous]